LDDATTSSTHATSGGTTLLVGGTGYVGDTLRERLRNAGHNLRLLIRSGDAARYERDGFSTAQGDITDANSLVAAMEGVDAVINLVAVIKEQGDATFERLNYQGSVNVVDAARQAGVDRIIQMSALGAGNIPDFPYHYTKWRAENYVKDSGLRWTIFRPSIIFGPGQKFQFLTALTDLVKQAPVIPVVGDGRSRFQPVHLKDVSDAFERALSDPAATTGQTYELAGADVVTYEQILDEVAATLGKRKRKVHVPVAMMMPAATIMNAIPFIPAPVTTDQLKMLKLDNTTEHNAIPELTGHAPLPFHGNIGYIVGDAQAAQAAAAERSFS
jgi:NADH dehydrogenase